MRTNQAASQKRNEETENSNDTKSLVQHVAERTTASQKQKKKLFVVENTMATDGRSAQIMKKGKKWVKLERVKR